MIDKVRGEATLCSAISLGASLLLTLLYRCVPSVRKTPGWLVIRATCCDIIVSASIVALMSSHRLGDDSFFYLPDAVWLEIICVTEVCAASLRSFMYMYLLSIYRNPFQPERLRIFHVPVAISSVVGSYILQQVATSYFPHSAADKRLVSSSLGLVFFPFLVFFLLGGGLFVTVQILVRNAKYRTPVRRATGGNAAASCIISLARQRVSKHGIAYFFLFSIELGTVAVMVVLWGVVENFDNDSQYWPLAVYAVTLRPAVSFAGWMVINDMVYKLCGCCSNKRRRDSIAIDQQMRALQVAGDQSLSQTELNAVEQGITEQGFKEELRFELLFDVVRGLGELGQRELHGSAEDRRSFRHGSGGAARSPSAMSIELSRKRTIELGEALQEPSMGPKESRHSRKDDFLRRDRESQNLMPQTAASFDFSSLGQPEPSASSSSPGQKKSKERERSSQKALLQPTSSNSMDYLEDTEVSRARHYEPHIFARVREKFGISRSMFASSFPNDLNELSEDWRSKLKESVSEGASGCFFYRVLGRAAEQNISQLIVKQITASEKNCFLGVLPAYEKHVVAQNGKSLIQYFGVHSMPLNWNFSRKVYFVVMRNVFPVKMWLTFDLKGATVNRRALAENILYKKKGEDLKVDFGTLRDWEWLDVAMAVDVSSADRKELASIVAADSKFLADQGLLDYSLLLGIHRIPHGLLPDQRQTHLAKMKKIGGYISLDRQKVYFFGIVDVLEHYGCRWKVQSCVLKTAYHLVCSSQALGITALPPLDYADRFHTFIRQEVLLIRGEEDGEKPKRGHRWSRLWDNRQRGLARALFEAEREDHYAATEELQQQTKNLEEEMASLKRALRERGEETEPERTRKDRFFSLSS